MMKFRSQKKTDFRRARTYVMIIEHRSMWAEGITVCFQNKTLELK